jgi:uncharacterized protein (TIGR02444 family)
MTYFAFVVAEECVALKDDHYVDLSLLVFCRWLGGSRKVGFMWKDIKVTDAADRPWRNGVVKPLR